MNKLCKQCGESKDESLFYRNYNKKQGKHYVASYCIDCSNQRSRDYHNANRQKRIKQNREWQLNKKYNITELQYEQMHQRQDGRCRICNSKETYKRLAVDHSHKTGKVRGLLCEDCNLGLGKFKDDIALLKIAIQYLIHGEENNESKATETDA